MFRIHKDELASQSVVTVDGDLSGVSVRLLEEYVAGLYRTAHPLMVVLRDVPTIDLNGRELLCRLVRAGVQLRGVGLYTSYVIERLNGATGTAADPRCEGPDSR